jgi:hypothetical protein
MTETKRFLHILGDAPLMLIAQVPPEFNLGAFITQMKADQHYFDGAGVFIPYHSIRCLMLTTGETPPAVPGYSADGSNIVPFPGKLN